LARALLLSLLASPIAAVPSLSMSVSSPEVSVNGVISLHITTKIQNTGDEPLRLLNDPHSILTPDWETDVFNIVKAGGGARPDFRGVMVKWSPTLATENNATTVITPGQSVEFTHDLSRRYDFTTAGAGTFDFHALDTFTHIDPTGNLVSLKAAHSSPASVSITGSLDVVRVTPRSAKFARRAKFERCDAGQEAMIITAAGHAQVSADKAFAYLQSHTSATSRYTTWFGAYTTSHHTTVKSHFQKIRGSDFLSFTYDCFCPKADTFAYVYPDQFGKIYLCAAFWKAHVTGTDSQAGTLIHESSHFTRNGGTKDHMYGQPGCKSLANTRSGDAIMNADSHEYFAENTPHLN